MPTPRAGDVDAAELQAADRLMETVALFAADQIVLGHLEVVENELGGIDALVADLLELASDREAVALLGEEQAHALVPGLDIGVGLDQHGKAGALDAV